MRRIAKLVRRIGAAALCLGLATGAATACPNWATQRTAFGGGQLTAGFMPDPIEVPRITAGGRHFLGDCFPGTNFTGFVITRPDYRLQYSGTSPTGYLKFTLVSGATDTVLLINAPDMPENRRWPGTTRGFSSGPGRRAQGWLATYSGRDTGAIRAAARGQRSW
jgi:hypothetical protein